jgi:hypothetical protein
MVASNTTRMLRSSDRAEVEISAADDYLHALQGGRITLALQVGGCACG